MNTTSETVVHVGTLDGQPSFRNATVRNVGHRADGTHFIVSLGTRVDVTAQPDGTYEWRQDARTVQSVNLAQLIRDAAAQSVTS